MSWTVHTTERNGSVRAWITVEPCGCTAFTATTRRRAIEQLADMLHGMADAADTAALEAKHALTTQGASA